MNVLNTMKVGSVSTFAGVLWTTPMDQWADLAMDGAVKYGLDCAQLFLMPGKPDSYYEGIRARCEESGLELDIGATMSLFDLTGENGAKAREDLLEMVRIAKIVNAKIMRRGYNGRLSFEDSRFNKEKPLEQHMQFVIDNLKAAEEILAPEGIYLAIENHCDFKGSEFAEIFKAVGSDYVGCALDTGNGFTVFQDPIDEAIALAPYTITTHIKDMVIRRDTRAGVRRSTPADAPWAKVMRKSTRSSTSSRRTARTPMVCTSSWSAAGWNTKKASPTKKKGS